MNTCGPTTSMKHEMLSKLREKQVGPPVSTNVEDSLMAETVLTQHSKKLHSMSREVRKDKIEKTKNPTLQRQGRKITINFHLTILTFQIITLN